MNMNKLLLILICFISLFICNYKVNAETYLATDTTSSSDVEYVADKPCDEQSIRTVMKVFGYILMFAKFIVPLLIIGFGTFDLFKSVIDKDEKSIYKQLKIVGLRLFAGIFIFFLPSLIYSIFAMSDDTNVVESNDYTTCAECLLKPTKNNKCIIESEHD